MAFVLNSKLLLSPNLSRPLALRSFKGIVPNVAAPAALQAPTQHCTSMLQTRQGTTGSAYLEKQKKLGRPLSPHVTIYAFPLAAWSSVAHRLTGGMLTIGLYGTGLAALFGADCAAIFSFLGATAWAPLLKAEIAFPVIYHYAAGMRHLYWERFPDGLNPQTQYQAAAALFAISGLGSLVAAFLL